MIVEANDYELKWSPLKIIPVHNLYLVSFGGKKLGDS